MPFKNLVTHEHRNMEGKTSNSSNTIDEVTKIWINILSSVQRQGLSFVLIAAMTWYFQTENDQLKGHISQCNQDKMEALKTLVERNTIAIENFSFYLRDNKISYEKK